MAIYQLGERTPNISKLAFVHPMATIIGDVTIGDYSTIWPGAVLRGDYGKIVVGERTSIQDGSVIHATAELPTIIGSNCTIGHIVHLEGCQIEDDALVGSGSVVLHRAVVSSFALVGANAVVVADTIVPSRALALGIPAKIFPDRVDEFLIRDAVEKYVENGQRYKSELKQIG
jgi:carbonic anhydrase/acetyltransferase-like protein (isoleucine patch superfamily)